ncbi:MULTISPECIES: bifunctional nuclease family protein [Anaeromyxobacter]|uniref:bifunctional nuclease family protein n=1 Tax=Anaeromyxobacter TaxID=161492 RepID=UPI001F5A2914|nr:MULTISPECIES: bifunctional nuclease domain-containing protein [unclassified Anaeromyxobacter]
MPAAGSISLPIAISAAAALALLTTAAPKPASAPDGRVELELAAALPMPEGPAALVVLRDRASGTVLPLLVPDGEALGVGARLGRAQESLLGRALDALGARVRAVEIDAAEETSTGARVRLEQGGREVEVTARPSESLALALASRVPIFTSRRLLAKAGLTPEELRESHAALTAKAGDDPLRL